MASKRYVTEEEADDLYRLGVTVIREWAVKPNTAPVTEGTFPVGSQWLWSRRYILEE